MHSKYEVICEELDVVTITYFAKLYEYTQTWKEAANQLQQGFMDLAHAKYTMGSHRISQYSYDERMKAALQVEIDIDDKLTLKHLPADQSSAKSKEQEGDTEKEGLRRRNIKHIPEKEKNSQLANGVSDDKNSTATVATANSDDPKEEIEMDEKKATKKIKKNGDPLYWFGLFVSPSLRTSQEHFKSATEQLIQQVNRLHELRALEEKYDQLMEEKLSLKLEETTVNQQQ